MEQQICFHVNPEASVEEAWEELSEVGVHPLYSSEEPDGTKEIIGYLPNGFSDETLLTQCKTVDQATPIKVEEVDWAAQWAAHGLDFYEGLVHLDLGKLGFSEEKLLEPQWRTIRLQPGPGFGDMSHPTTRLVLRLMGELVKDQYVLDIGCGSGVLTLCAIALGAKHAHGVDIDMAALEHAQRNAALNLMEARTSFGFPKDYQLPKEIERPVVLMNMIHSEQLVAMNALPQLQQRPATFLVSGVLETERQQYLKQCKRWGWKLQEELEEEGWLAFYLDMK